MKPPIMFTRVMMIPAMASRCTNRLAPRPLPEVIRLVFDLLAAFARLLVRDQPVVQVGVNAHLLAGHGVQGEPGRDLADALRAVCDLPRS